MWWERPDFCTEVVDGEMEDILSSEEREICWLDDDLWPTPWSDEEDRLYRESLQIREQQEREEELRIQEEILRWVFKG